MLNRSIWFVEFLWVAFPFTTWVWRQSYLLSFSCVLYFQITFECAISFWPCNDWPGELSRVGIWMRIQKQTLINEREQVETSPLNIKEERECIWRNDQSSFWWLLKGEPSICSLGKWNNQTQNGITLYSWTGKYLRIYNTV